MKVERTEAAPDNQMLHPIEAQEPQYQNNPGHLQLNGLRSRTSTSTSSDSSSLRTHVAFTQPDAWELAFIDELPPKNSDPSSKCCKLPCFPGQRDESSEVPANRAPPIPSPTTIDTPNKILSKWQPVYPQQDKFVVIRSPEGTDFRDPRVKTWHGNTMQQPSTYRPISKPRVEHEYIEVSSPTTQQPENPVQKQENLPPIPKKASGRLKASTKPHELTQLNSSTVKGCQMPLKSGVLTEDGGVSLTNKHLPREISAIAKRPVKAAAKSVSNETAQSAQPSRSRGQKQAKNSQKAARKPLRISTRQPERKAKERAARQGKPVEVDHPPIFYSVRMFRSLPGPSRISDERIEKRSATTSHTTISANPDLPSTWRLTLSTSSSLKVAMEAASQEMENKEAKKAMGTGLPLNGLLEEGQPHINNVKSYDESPSCSVDKDINPPTEIQYKMPHENPQNSEGSSPTELDDRKIDDRDVLRGLNIAISAACNEDVDAWIRQRTGVRIRRFLADLRAFETLGDVEQPDPKHELARNRRAGSRKLKAQIQQSRAAREARAH
ncbi:uncharacterized protein CTRU02_205372 [Colletotrichum truncatum]|uniref:Uncharacterized protein n=1 Tax=Colletotrichum truncatum TaxID=5467 RepID=A0ACC3Z3V4_COLTU